MFSFMVMVVFAAILNTSDDAYVGTYEISIPRICIFYGIQAHGLFYASAHNAALLTQLTPVNYFLRWV